MLQHPSPGLYRLGTRLGTSTMGFFYSSMHHSVPVSNQHPSPGTQHFETWMHTRYYEGHLSTVLAPPQRSVLQRFVASYHLEPPMCNMLPLPDRSTEQRLFNSMWRGILWGTGAYVSHNYVNVQQYLVKPFGQLYSATTRSCLDFELSAGLHSCDRREYEDSINLSPVCALAFRVSLPAIDLTTGLYRLRSSLTSTVTGACSSRPPAVQVTGPL
ncbi:hypothetical protein M011DRAFT_459916 [Sporormia fimetaria CBS 119925]|uniref:Uncharacterized protein n=1 Tax=Sporormia fimetaria CBS 119925 TaxID=1340428 RepID=A0A6A6V529_9PLEO|nr:hypothetical protein M011DRAFT_459916 [Sporormia fimetaria CBS 119925]